MPEPHFCPGGGEPSCGGRRQQLAQADARQQQVGRARSREKRIAQDPQEDFPAGFAAPACSAPRRKADRSARRRTRCGRVRVKSATVRPGKQRKRLSTHAAAMRISASLLRGLQARCRATARTKARNGLPPPRRRPTAVGIDQAQAGAQEALASSTPTACIKRSVSRVGADADVLAVVEHQASAFELARASAQLRRHLEERYLRTRSAGFDRSRQARPAAADDADPAPRLSGDANLASPLHQCPRQFVRMAIHSLRSGVSAVRWCSTRKSSRLDLAQQRAVDVGHHQPGLLRPPVGLGQQRQRCVVQAMRTLGLESHQRREAIAVAARLRISCALTSNRCRSATGR